MKVTYRIASAAGQDAGNRMMKAKGLTQWDEGCWNEAAAVMAKLLAL